MYPSKYNSGDAGHIALELLDNVPEIEQKCFAVTKAVKEGFFSLTGALYIYEISPEDYVKYLIKKVITTVDKKRINILLGVFLTLHSGDHTSIKTKEQTCLFDENDIQNHLEAIGQIVATQKNH